MITIDPKITRAVLFDLNGTLIHDGEIQRLAMRETFRKLDVVVTPQDYEIKVANRLNKQIWPDILEREVSKDELAALSEMKEQLYRSMIAEEEGVAVKGSSACINELRDRGVLTALVTTSPPRTVDYVLDYLGLANHFDSIVTGSDVSRGKPDPEIYLLALDRLGVEAGEAIVFEDSPQGVQAARALNIRTIGVLPEYTKETLEKLGVTEFIDSFEEVSIKKEE